jgi:hypothetical protein
MLNLLCINHSLPGTNEEPGERTTATIAADVEKSDAAVAADIPENPAVDLEGKSSQQDKRSDADTTDDGGEDAANSADAAATATAMAGMSEAQQRLFRLRMRINQGRKANRSAVEEEFKQAADPKYEQRQRYLEQRSLRKEEGHGEDDSAGDREGAGARTGAIGKQKELMQVTAEAAERQKQKMEEKEKNVATFGMQVLCLVVPAT